MLLQNQQKAQLITPITDTERKQGFLSVPTSPLLMYSPDYALTLAQAFEGIQVFGATGSGKTSGSLSHISRALLYGGFGGLVLCAKEDEAQNWIDYAEETGRSDSLMLFGRDNHRFNFIAYELARGVNPFEVADVFENARDALNPEAASGGDNKIWSDAGKMVLVAALVILYGSTGTVELEELKKLLNTAPESKAEAFSKEWADGSLLVAHVNTAIDNNGRFMPRADVEKARDYFKFQYASLADRTRSSVLMNLMLTLNRFDYGMLCDRFTKQTTIVPDLIHSGAIIIIDLPAMGSEEGRIAAHIWKYAFQRATTRQADETTRPVFLAADEAQYFYSANDVVFQSTARSSRVATLYATQSLDAYRDALGGTEKAATATRAFLANLRTQIFHANGSDETNIYGSTLIGKTLQWRRNQSTSTNSSSSTNEGWSEGVSDSFSEAVSRGRNMSSSAQGGSFGRNSGDSTTEGSGTTTGTSGGKSDTFGSGLSEGASEQKDFTLDPDVFLNGMRRGNSQYDYLVDAVIVSPEIPLPYLPVTFDQRAS